MKSRVGTIAVIAAFTAPMAVFGVDGVVLIDQSRALAGNVTPGDTPGFPVSITQPGSYKLSGSLIVSNGDTTAIEIASHYVTIDLNGFSIIGPTDCSGGFHPCAGAGNGTGRGIGTRMPNVYFNVAIRNGTIQGAGGDGVRIVGDSVVVESVISRSNGGFGIFVSLTPITGGNLLGENIILKENNVQRNGGGGIFADPAMVSDNVVRRNGTTGITVIGEGGLISRNISSFNELYGLNGNDTSAFSGNVLVGNGAAAVIHGGPVNLGHNFCSDVTC